MQTGTCVMVVLFAATGVVGCATESDGSDPLRDDRGDPPAGDGSGGGYAWAAAAKVTINEIESLAGVPGDWVELVNTGGKVANLAGWRFRDGAAANPAYVFPAGTTLAVGGTLVLHQASFGFDLDAADSARLYNAANTLIDSYSWSTHATYTYGRCPAGSGSFRATVVATPGAANDCSTGVKLNELESTGGVPGDWAEIVNTTTVTIDLTGWKFRDELDTHVYSFPAGATLAPGAYRVLEQSAWSFSLGDADSARLYDSTGRLLDSFAWTTPAATTYGRCPDGSGGFTVTSSVTRGAGNDCGPPPPPPPTIAPWPGLDAVIPVDEPAMFPSNLSDLTYAADLDPALDDLWAVRNDPSLLHRLRWNGATWTPEVGSGWEAGKTLRYPTGLGRPDAEGMTRLDATSIYVVAERNNDASTVSRLSVLRYDPTAPGAELIATHEWNLTADLPPVGANLGLEAITWIPDDFLVGRGFFDERAGHLYQPADYPDHGGGLFFVGVEGTGAIHAYALDHVGGGFARVATIASGHSGVMSLAFDADVGYLWAACDAACGGETTVLDIDTAPASPTFGRFAILRTFARPTSMTNLDNEGIAIAPEARCVDGHKPFYWTEDGNTGGHALRADTIPCGRFVP
jgi:hypothetical protein